MRKLFSIKAFLFGVAIALTSYAIFIAFTLSVGWESQLRNRTNKIGFPFAFWESGGEAGAGRFVVSGMIWDAVIVGIYSIIVGMLFSVLWRVQTTHYVER